MSNFSINKQTAWNHTSDDQLSSLYNQQADMYNLMSAMGLIVSVHDDSTTKHHENVAKLAQLFAKYLSLPDEDTSAVYYAGLIHDYGKVYIPKDVLNKPGRLTAQEFEEVKKHSAYTADSMSHVSSMQGIGRVVRAHHERWDGHGYPDGLAGEQIPLSARILAIVDAFDAMTNDHPYQKAMTRQEAMDELARMSGAQFDPVLVPEFLKFISSIEPEKG